MSRRRIASARPRALVVAAATFATVAVAGACGDTGVVAPGDSVRGRISAGDSFGGILRLAVRICIDSGFQTAFANYDRADSVSTRFKLPVPASTPQNALVIVEGQVNDEQSFFITTQDTIVARSPGVQPGPSPRQPTCAR